MKKTLFIIIFIIISYYIVGKFTVNSIEIPENAIRLRVLANSDSNYDQEIKIKVRDKVQERLYSLLKEVKSTEEARVLIKKNTSNLEEEIEKVLTEENYKLGFRMDYGNHYFPEKKFKGVTYKEGYYESLLVTIGSGKGNNWWCVLFPPLCLLEAEDSEEVEYKLLIEEIIEKYI